MTGSDRAPLVSVIIPTTRRHDLVLRALSSVTAQTVTDIEIIVVVDGPNPLTLAALDTVEAPRLRVLHNQTPLGPGAARNRAAAIATGTWLAFLDDDDVWLPEKLERQLAAAGDAPVLVSCLTRVVTPRGTSIAPRRVYDGRVPLDEYLFDRRSVFRGDAEVETSSLLLPRHLFDRTGFGTTRHREDTTLMLRVVKREGARLIMVPETLLVVHREEERESLGSVYDWRQMLAWADSMDGLLTRRAYSGFCLIYLGSQAAQRRDLAGFFVLLRRAFARGAPTFLQVLMFFVFWAIPIGLRGRVRVWAWAFGKRQGLLF